MRFRARVLFGFAAFAACARVDAEGTARVHMFHGPCGDGPTSAPPTDFTFGVSYAETERFGGVLLMHVLEYPASLEEADGFVIRLDLDALLEDGRLVVDHARSQIVRAEPQWPLVLAIDETPTGANASLSLFETCRNLATFAATSGALSLSTLTLAREPSRTGVGERIEGTLTATIALDGAKKPSGTLEAEFAFAPPTRPLVDFK